MLIIRAQIHNIRSAEVKDRATGGRKTNHYLDILPIIAATANGIAESVKLPDNVDLDTYRKAVGKTVQMLVRASAYEKKVYFSMINDQPPGVFGFITSEGQLTPV